MKIEKKKSEVKEQVTIMIEPSITKHIERMANTIGITRSQLMRNMLLNGYDDAKTLDNFGLLKAYGVGKNFVDKVKNALDKGAIDFNSNGKIIFKDK